LDGSYSPKRVSFTQRCRVRAAYQCGREKQWCMMPPSRILCSSGYRYRNSGCRSRCCVQARTGAQIRIREPADLATLCASWEIGRPGKNLFIHARNVSETFVIAHRVRYCAHHSRRLRQALPAVSRRQPGGKKTFRAKRLEARDALVARTQRILLLALSVFHAGALLKKLAPRLERCGLARSEAALH